MSNPKNLTAYRTWNRKYWMLALALLIALTGLEARTYFVEKALGQYLAWQNPGREKVGRQWQVEQKRLLAGTRLEKISKELRSREKQLASIPNFLELIRRVLQENQLVIPAQHFIRLYHTLPFFLKEHVIAPDSLIALRLQDRLDNVILNREADGVEMVLIDAQSRIENILYLSNELLDVFFKHGQSEVVDVTSDPRFAGRVFRFELFWQNLSQLPKGMQNNFLQAMPDLLTLAGPTAKVAISNKISENLVEVAVAPDNFRAVIYYLPEDWIINFVSTLEYPWMQNEEQDIL
ncbi:MAG: hypothetical protein Q9P90_00030 [candidate division KSB1 bacterium]|nr:hypothetical protein [candidate division KSB1 bacterium]